MGRDSTLVLQKNQNKGAVFSFVLTYLRRYPNSLCYAMNVCTSSMGSSINERIWMKCKAKHNVGILIASMIEKESIQSV